MLESLGVPPAAKCFPITTGCPICLQGRLRMIQDTCQIGAWYHCPACKSFGDIVDLVGNTRKLSDTAAFQYIRDVGAMGEDSLHPSELARRRRPLATRTRDMWQLWSEASQEGRVVIDLGAQPLLSQMKLVYDNSLSWSAKNVSGVLGTLPASRFEELMASARRTSERHLPVKVRRKYTHRDETNVLLLPYFDVPGRIRSLAMLRPVPNKTTWHVTHHEIPYTYSGTTVAEDGGLAIHPDAVANTYDSMLLLTSDVELYVRLTMKHFMKSPAALPIACYRSKGAITKNWQMLGSCQPVIWSPKRTPQSIWQAIKLDAKVCDGAHHVTRYEFVNKRDPAHTVRRFLKTAKPWPAVVAELAEEKTDYHLADWLAAAHLNEQEQQLVISECPAKYRDKLKRAMGESVVCKSFPADGGMVQQRAGGWFFMRPDGSEQLVTDAPFHVQEAVMGEDGAEYRVLATYMGNQFTFNVDRQQFHKSAFDIVQERAIEAGVGVPTYDPKWKSRAIHWSLQFHAPSAVTSTIHVGMDAERECFNLPRVRLSTTSGGYRSIATSSVALPGQSIDASQPLQDVVPLLDAASARPALAIFTGVVHQVLRNIAGMQQPAIVLQGLELSLAANSLKHSLSMLTTDDLELKRWSLEKQHRWPVLAADSLLRSVSGVRRAVQMDDCPLIIEGSPYLAAYSMFATQHVVITAGQTKFNPELNYAPLGKLLLEIASHACSTGFRDAFVSGGGKLSQTIEIIFEAMKANKLSRRQVRLASQWCQQRTDAAKAMVDIAATFIATGKTRVGHYSRGTTMADDLCYRDTENEQVFVRMKELRQLLREEGCPAFDQRKMLADISSSDTPVGVQLIGGHTCWAVPANLFDTAVASRRQTIAPSLRIAN